MLDGPISGGYNRPTEARFPNIAPPCVRKIYVAT